MRSDAALENGGRSAEGPDPAAPGCPASGAERGAAAVSSGPEHASLP